MLRSGRSRGGRQKRPSKFYVGADHFWNAKIGVVINLKRRHTLFQGLLSANESITRIGDLRGIFPQTCSGSHDRFRAMFISSDIVIWQVAIVALCLCEEAFR